MRRTSHFLPLLILVSLLLVACDLLAGQTAIGTPTAAAPAATPVMTQSPEVTAQVPEPPEVGPPATLRVWLPPEIGARTEEGARELATQARAFETAHVGLEVIIEQKPVDGQGGIVDYLRTGRAVAPSVIPDLVAVPTSVLADPNSRGLFVPLDGLIDPAFLSGTYPAAAGQVVSDNRLYGYPFASMGLTHLIYRPGPEREALPLVWSQFISDTNHTLVFPADSREGALFGLQFYLAEGGALTDDRGQPSLQAEPLARALGQIGLRKEGLLQSHQLKTLDETWQYHQLGLSSAMWTRAEYLLPQLAANPALATEQAFMPAPGPSGVLTPLTTNWAWALTTTDNARQAVAAELVLYLTKPENLASWAGRSRLLPAQRDAIELLAKDNAYYAFAGEELERATAMPVSESGRLLDVLGDAVFQMLTTDRSPETIAEEAVLASRQ